MDKNKIIKFNNIQMFNNIFKYGPGHENRTYRGEEMYYYQIQN